jgi:hypothetical protein
LLLDFAVDFVVDGFTSSNFLFLKGENSKIGQTAGPSTALPPIPVKTRGVDQDHAVFLRKTAHVVAAGTAK